MIKLKEILKLTNGAIKAKEIEIEKQKEQDIISLKVLCQEVEFNISHVAKKGEYTFAMAVDDLSEKNKKIIFNKYVDFKPEFLEKDDGDYLQFSWS